MYDVVYTKKALSDIPKLKASKLDTKVKMLISLIKQDPYQSPPQFEKLLGDMAGAFSRMINHKHRLVYEVLEEKKTVKIISMWSHYEF